MSRKPRKCRVCKHRPVWRGGDVKNPGPVCKKCYHKKGSTQQRGSRRANGKRAGEFPPIPWVSKPVEERPPWHLAREWANTPPRWIGDMVEEPPAWLNEIGETSTPPPLDRTEDKSPPPWLAELVKDLPDPGMYEEHDYFLYWYEDYCDMLDRLYGTRAIEDSPPDRLVRRWGNTPPKWMVDVMEESPPAWLHEVAEDSTPPPLEQTRDESPPPWLDNSLEDSPPPWPDDEAGETPFVWPYPIPDYDWWVDY